MLNRSIQKKKEYTAAAAAAADEVKEEAEKSWRFVRLVRAGVIFEHWHIDGKRAMQW